VWAWMKKLAWIRSRFYVDVFLSAANPQCLLCFVLFHKAFVPTYID